jgi:8-oxo-dGTP pyrophosphatase MutT (NUDIX family)
VLEGTVAPAPLRDAATVLLLREGVEGVEVYLLRRVSSMAFAAGMTVFPGGGVDERDAEDPGTGAGWVGPPPREWAGVFTDGDDRLARALVCAAVRETFEESGVVLAGPSADSVVTDVDDDSWETDRQALLAREQALGAVLLRRRLVLRADLLRPWAHWVTPEVEPIRYDTRFFAAALPRHQRPRDVGGEADRHSWRRPADALAAWRRGEMAMMPPTTVALEALLGHEDVASVLAARQEVRRVLPRLVPDGRGVELLLPGQPGYGEAAPGAWGGA